MGFSGIWGLILGGSKILCDLGRIFFYGFRGNLMGCVIFQCTRTHGNKSLCPQGTIDKFMQCFETCFGFIRGTQYVTIVPHCNPDFSGVNILWLTMARDCNWSSHRNAKKWNKSSNDWGSPVSAAWNLKNSWKTLVLRRHDVLSQCPATCAIPGLVNVYILPWKDPPFFMGKSTISTGPFSIAFCMFTRGYLELWPSVDL